MKDRKSDGAFLYDHDKKAVYDFKQKQFALVVYEYEFDRCDLKIFDSMDETEKAIKADIMLDEYFIISGYDLKEIPMDTSRSNFTTAASMPWKKD